MKRQAVIPLTGRGDSHDQFEVPPPPGILEVKHARQRSLRLIAASRNRVVCRFWLEKLLVTVDALQLFALLWQLSQPWPWPSRWLRHTRWANAFNIDVFSFTATGAAMGATSQAFSLWGEMRHYWIYALMWSLLPLMAVTALQAFTKRWEGQGRLDYMIRHVRWENALLQIFQVLYLPIGLAVLRLFNCDASGRVSVDPQGFSTCWSLAHSVAFVFITCGLGGGFLIGFPLLLRRRIQSAVYTADDSDGSDDHERFVQSKELEFILRTSDAYLELSMPQYASYRRHAIYKPVETCVFKLALLLVFSVMRSPVPGISNQGLQGSVFFLAFLLMAWRQTAHPAFRFKSTNQIAKTLSWLLTANGAIALLCANGVRSALTVSTAVNASLTFVNVTGLVVLTLPLTSSVRQWRRRDRLEVLPSLNEIAAPYACWPTHPFMREIITLGSELEAWISQLQRARALSIKTAVAASTMQPFHELSTMTAELEASWKHANDACHLLAGQLHQELLVITDLYVNALGTTPFKDVSLRQSGGDAAYETMYRILKHKDDQERLLPVMNRRVLSKLRAVKTWMAENGSRTHANSSLQELVLEKTAIYQGHLTDEVSDWVDIKGTIIQTSSEEKNEVAALNVLKWSASTGLMECYFQGTTVSAFVALRDLREWRYQVNLIDSGHGAVLPSFAVAVASSKEISSHGFHQAKVLDQELLHKPSILSGRALDELVGTTDTASSIDAIVNQTL